MQASSYSNYQRIATRFLSVFLGTDTLITCRINQRNYLEVLIDIGPKPIFNERRHRLSQLTIISAVNCEIRASKAKSYDVNKALAMNCEQ